MFGKVNRRGQKLAVNVHFFSPILKDCVVSYENRANLEYGELASYC